MEYSPLRHIPVNLYEAAAWKFGGDSEPQRQTTEVKLTPEQRRVQKLALPYIEQFAQQGISAPTTSQVAGFDPAQIAGQNLALSAAGGGQTDIANLGAQTADFLSGDVLNPATNPALQGAIDASIAPLYDQLTQTVLPNIRGESALVGQFGGSRQGVAEGLAAQATQRAAGETASRVANENYQAGLDALVKNQVLLPQTSALQLTPALTTAGVGDVRQALQQALLSEQVSNQNFEQLAPLLVGQELAAISAGLPGGSTVTTATTPQPDPFAQLLGIGATALGTFFGGPVGGAVGSGLSNALVGPTNIDPSLPWLR